MMVAALFVPKLRGGLIALDTTHTSTLAATINNPNASYSATVGSLPYVTPLSDSDQLESVTVTPSLSSSNLSFNFSQAAYDSSASDQGVGTIYFVPETNVQYTIAGSITNSVPGYGGIFANLADLTKNETLYAEGVGGDDNPLLLNTAGGPLNGSLTAGDIYEFQVGVNLDAPASVNGTASINFTPVPEPETLGFWLPGSTLVAVILRRQRRARVC